ncbi:MAG: prolipoprotein diacylglyceryl transferase [Cyclobacteriaceae bacterium]
MLSYIIWNFNPDLFTIPGLDYAPRWYGVLFALGFILSQQVMIHIFKTEGRPVKDVDKLTTYMVVAVIAGARLGHCLFYDPIGYLSDPLRILMVWEGGLASHGGALGMLIALYLFAKKLDYKFLWILDRIVIVGALTATLIRTGNLFNSEMEGIETNSNTGIVYARATHDVLNYDENRIESVSFRKGGQMTSDVPGVVPITAVIRYKEGVKLDLNEKNFIESRLKYSLTRYTEVAEHVDFGSGPLQYLVDEKNGQQIVEIFALAKVRHAAQLYEAAYAFVLMLVLFWLWHKKRDVLPQGFNFALLMIVLWSLRFVDEFFKMNQETFEDDLALNMGQILSIPLTLAGVVIMVLVFRKDKKMSDFS